MAEAGSPTKLALIGVEVLHPQLGSVWMRRVGADCLHVHTGKATFSRHNGFQIRVAGKGYIVCDRVVRPVDQDWSLADPNGAGIAVNRNEVASLIELLKELESGIGSFLASSAGCQTCCPYRKDGCIGTQWVARQGNLSVVLRFEQVGVFGGRVRHFRCVN